MVRSFIALLMMTAPALAWQADTGAACVVRHETDKASVVLSYEPLSGDYAIAITSQTPWKDSPTFAMRFDGPRYNVITTDRHTINEDRSTLTVTDTGFGNVLDGLEFNHVATAATASQLVVVPLVGAAPAIQEFRACAEAVRV